MVIFARAVLTTLIATAVITSMAIATSARLTFHRKPDAHAMYRGSSTRFRHDATCADHYPI